MFYKALSETSSGNRVTARVDIPGNARSQAVIVTASGKSSYTQGGGASAGITLTIEANNTNARISDDSFEGESSSMTYRANCAHTFGVGPEFDSWVTATVTPLGAGGDQNRDSEVFLSVVAIPTD